MGNNLCGNKTDSTPGQYVGAGGASETTRLTGDNVSDSISKLSLEVCCGCDAVGVEERSVWVAGGVGWVHVYR